MLLEEVLSSSQNVLLFRLKELEYTGVLDAYGLWLLELCSESRSDCFLQVMHASIYDDILLLKAQVLTLAAEMREVREKLQELGKR